MKEWVVSDPHYTEFEICDKDKFIILACDGVYNLLKKIIGLGCIDRSRCCKFIKRRK
jgi:hypothetical protein